MGLIKLTIKGISYSQTQTGAYALVLSEMEGSRTLPIIIGAFEAQSIAIALEKEIRPPRPLTHDLFKTFSDRFSIEIKEVIIHKLIDGVFFSSLICKKDGVEEVIDARTSDAIALAIRFNSPIFTYEDVLEKAGIIIDPENSKKTKKDNKEQTPQAKKIEYSKLSISQLEKAIAIAVKNEDYELAAHLRDEIKRKK